MFVNGETDESAQNHVTTWSKSWEEIPSSNRLNYLIEANVGQSSKTHDDLHNEDIQNALEISPEMDSLNRTLQRQLSGDMGEIQVAMLKQVRLSNFDPQALATWTSGFLGLVANYNTQARGQRLGIWLSNM